jgi:hypothetical protein
LSEQRADPQTVVGGHRNEGLVHVNPIDPIVTAVELQGGAVPTQAFVRLQSITSLDR